MLTLVAVAACARSAPVKLTRVAVGPTEPAVWRPAVTATVTSAAEPTDVDFLPFIGREGAFPTATQTVTATPPPATATAPPPTPTPVPWPEAIDTLTESKLGIHSLGTGDPFLMEFVRRAKPRVVKAVGDYGWLLEVKQASPDTITIARIVGNQETWFTQGYAPEAAARNYVETYLPEYRANAGVDYWEGWNELAYGDGEQSTKLAWYGKFEAARACLMQEYGFRAAVGGFAVGWPAAYADWEYFMPAVQAAARCNGILHLHEYNRPFMRCGVMLPGTAGVIPGAPAFRVETGPYTLRYRVWYEGYLKPRGLGNVPLVISETGVDAVPVSAGCPDPGADRITWQAMGDAYQSAGSTVGTPESYVNDLAWYDARLREDPYVLGATIFSAGQPSTTDGWGLFDIHQAFVPLAWYLVSQR